MTPSLPVIVAVFAAPAVGLPTELWQVAPDAKGRPVWLGGPRAKDRAVLLVPGLKIHPLRPAHAARPELREWQQPACDLVRALAKDSDVFAFGYAQTVPLDEVAHSPGLRDAVGRLKAAGYREIVLVGHSAGGVIARLFAENYPDSGVTKVVTVASPHAGTEAANVPVGYPRAQAAFVQSLSPEARAQAGTRKLDEKIEMACVVCKLRRIEADGLVGLGSQWPEDCRKLGIPAVLLPTSHWDSVHSPAGAKVIADLAREKLTRWSAEEVEKARKVLFRDPEERPSAFRRRMEK